MSDEQDQEKTEEPTQRKLDKAREDGQVPRSKELTTFLMLLCSLGTVFAISGSLYETLSKVMESAFTFDRSNGFDAYDMMMSSQEMGSEAFFGIMPLLVMTFVLAVVIPNLLSGPNFSAKSLKPQLGKINPLKGFKRIFGEQALVELVKVIAKTILIGAMLYAFMQFKMDDFRSLLTQSTEQSITKGLMLSFQISMLLVCTLVVAAIIDVPYQLYSHKKKLKMSMYEIKKEMKESEGDPMIKARIRQQQQEMSRNRMMAAIPDADVVINNPTHFSVALKYTENMAAPIVVAKGRNDIAMKIREIANENNVPMLSAPPLARAVYHHVDLEHPIPTELFTAVAEVLAWAFSIKKNQNIPKPINLPVPEGMDKGAEEGEN